jgi:succinate-semialdehyde dehydrogenase / glutarate-semialdehyde dehydrogenase
MYIISTNPSKNYELIGSVEVTSDSDIIAFVEQSRSTQKIWGYMSMADRASLLRGVYDRFVMKKETIAQSISTEMGMPIRLSRDEVQYGLNYFLWYLDNAKKYLSREVTFENEIEIHTVFYEPKWVIAAITPWNYPFMLCIWACIQPLLAGNTVVWKISKEVILTGALIADIFSSSDLPEWVWIEIFGDGKTGGFLTDQDIDGITFTGSTGVWEKLAQKAFDKWIPALLELGGSAPGIVCADADIDSVLETIYFMRYSNSGQMCDGLKRLIVHESRYDELIEKLGAKLLSKRIGDPSDETTDIGPLVSESQLLGIRSQLQDALDLWATILIENTPSSICSWAYMSAYILWSITPDMRIWKEEVFGPILPIVSFSTIDEAIDLANDTEYGLGAYVFTEDHDTFAHIVRELQSGMVQMNTVNYCIPQDPFGGYKSSWIGREHGKWGFHEFCNIKVISTPKK